MTDHVDTVFPGFLESLLNLWARPHSGGCRNCLLAPAAQLWLSPRSPLGFRLVGGASARELEGWCPAGTCQPTGALLGHPWLELWGDVTTPVRWGGRGTQGQESRMKDSNSLICMTCSLSKQHNQGSFIGHSFPLCEFSSLAHCCFIYLSLWISLWKDN